MPSRLPTSLALLLAVIALSLAACGGRESSDTSAGSDAATTEGSLSVPTVDGYLISADDESVVLRTEEGEQTFVVDPADLESVGIPHLASHAGLTDLGFRVYYEEQDGKKLIKASEEIPPPF